MVSTLDLLNSLEGENSILQYLLNNHIISRDYYKGLVDGAEKKAKDDFQSHKSTLKAMQDDLDKTKSEAKLAVEAQEKEI